MKERPILFSGSMVRAILEGRKTQTRRLVKFPAWVGDTDKAVYHLNREPMIASFKDGRAWRKFGCPYGQPGDRLWVRETWAVYLDVLSPNFSGDVSIAYRATDDMLMSVKWKPSIHMRREYSRIDLEVTGVRVERLTDISIPDLHAEGSPPATGNVFTWYRNLWESINGSGSYDANPWVWVVEFKQCGERVA